ncbi:MAG: methyltransferase domain-containing protein [Pyrinomonadaceae bacterium]
MQEIYGPEYCNAADSAPDGELTDEMTRVASWLRRANNPGTFIDYGCRKGVLLTEALKLGWRAIGVEINPDVAAQTEKQTGARVVLPDDPLLDAPLADILHLGDVIEHLTALDDQMPAILA